MIERIAVVGMGLIGGSLALAWKERREDLTLVGHDVPDVLEKAVRLGMIDHAAGSVQDAVRGADLVVLSVPLDAMRPLLKRAAPHLEPGALVTDVGSVKMPVLRDARRLLPPANAFVGGHPMAGSEKGGISSADAFLFENAAYVLCPPLGQESEPWLEQFAPLVEVVEATGARVFPLAAELHDRIAACISHLPQIVATALMRLVSEQPDKAFTQLAAGGFRDMTRIASSPFAMWDPILDANRKPILDALSTFGDILSEYARALEHKDSGTLCRAFDAARSLRDAIPRDSRGFLYPLSDIYVYAEDRPGVLAHITGTLFQNGISIKDIALLRIREGTGGAFRLSFENDQVAEAAVVSLGKAGCRAQRL